MKDSRYADCLADNIMATGVIAKYTAKDREIHFGAQGL